MWAVSCIIIDTSARTGELSYFSKDPLPEGSVITVPLRGKDAYALVVSCESVSTLKQTIRAQSFKLRKLVRPKARRIYTRAFLRAVFEVSMIEACPPGALLGAYTPLSVLASRDILPEVPLTPREDVHDALPEVLLLSLPKDERVSEYKRIARECLARGTSLQIITPTVVEAERLYEALKSGISEYASLLHGSLSKKKLLTAWSEALKPEHPRVIIGTPFALSLARADITTIVIEREGSRAYVRTERPYTHDKVIIEQYAKNSGARCIFASIAPSVESAWRKELGDIQEFGHSRIHLPGAPAQIIDLRPHKKDAGGYNPLTSEMYATLQKSLAENPHTVMLAARRGLAPNTVCDDCGTTLTCPQCKTPLVLHNEKGRFFLCHYCSEEVPASVRCGKCGGWRLTTLGIAVDGVAHALEKYLPETPLHTCTDETKGREEKIVTLWQEKGGILLGTERLLPYLPDHIPTICVASIDSFLSIPEYGATERAYLLLAELKSRADTTFAVQTRDPGHPVMKMLKEGSTATFLANECAERERFGYPPAVTLVRFTFTGTPDAVEVQARTVALALEHLSPRRIAARSLRRGHAREHILLRLPKGAWVDQRLLRFIRGLPPSVEVRINPSSLND